MNIFYAIGPIFFFQIIYIITAEDYGVLLMQALEFKAESDI